MLSALKCLRVDESGAIAPTFALSLFALIAVGGIAFDYARLAAMDSELQNAADQAALAAASQLDGKSGACVRASNAAVSLVSNQTRFANDGNASGANVTITGVSDCTFAAGEKVRFYQDIAKTPATSDANAKFVEVTVDARTAVYALTPVVGAFNSGAIAGTAMAGLGSAICKVPPVMICNPNEGADPDFTVANYIGKGLKLVAVGNGNSAWAPGNFGYLDTGYPTSNPNIELRQALGWINVPGDCSGLGGVRTRTGAGTPVTQAINTRFDIYERANNNALSGKGNNGNAGNPSCPSGGTCPPSINSIKDVVMKGAPANASKCGLSNNEWELPANPYLPSSATADLTTAQMPNSMGHPRDKCHAVAAGTSGECTGPVGNGNWDRNAYFFVNYGWNSSQWQANLALGTNPVPAGSIPSVTRYRVYQWEIDNRGATIGGRVILPTGSRSVGGAFDRFDRPVCGPLQGYGAAGSGLVPGGSTVDRRRISAAVLNCTANSVNGGGNTVYPVQKWVEFFLVEPSLNRDRTDANDVYVEVIGETSLAGAGGATAGQVTNRDVPYLVE